MAYPGPMIDSHCHLADKQFIEDVNAVIKRANSAGVEQMICIADSIEEGNRCRMLAEQYACVFWTMGVHPHVAAQFNHQHDPGLICEALTHPKCKAVGEIGLDYHYMLSPRDIQQRAFETQLLIARDHDVPAVVHCREAVEDVWAIINNVKPKKLVLHCCTERWMDVERFVSAGYFLSFTGIATYPDAQLIRDTIRHCPLAQMMIETDAPYLPPEALRAKGGRGQRNEPAFVVEVATLIAMIKGVSQQEVESVTMRNAVDFFGLPVRL